MAQGRAAAPSEVCSGRSGWVSWWGGRQLVGWVPVNSQRLIWEWACPEMRGLSALCTCLLSQHCSSSLSALWGQALRGPSARCLPPGSCFRCPLWEVPLLGAASVGAASLGGCVVSLVERRACSVSLTQLGGKQTWWGWGWGRHRDRMGTAVLKQYRGLPVQVGHRFLY